MSAFMSPEKRLLLVPPCRPQTSQSSPICWLQICSVSLEPTGTSTAFAAMFLVDFPPILYRGMHIWKSLCLLLIFMEMVLQRLNDPADQLNSNWNFASHSKHKEQEGGIKPITIVKRQKQINQQPSVDNADLPILSLVSGNSTKRTATLV